MATLFLRMRFLVPSQNQFWDGLFQLPIDHHTFPPKKLAKSCRHHELCYLLSLIELYDIYSKQKTYLLLKTIWETKMKSLNVYFLAWLAQNELFLALLYGSLFSRAQIRFYEVNQSRLLYCQTNYVSHHSQENALQLLSLMLSELCLEMEANLASHIRSFMAQSQPRLALSGARGLDCELILSSLKSLIYDYYALQGDQQVRIQLLYQHINSTFYKLPHPYLTLDILELEKSKYFFEAVIMPVVDFFSKQIHEDKQNVILENQHMIGVQCLCSHETEGELYGSGSKFCYRCGQRFHSQCFANTNNQQQHFQCPLCFLTYCLPDRKVIHTLFQGYLAPADEEKSSASVILNQWELFGLCDPSICIEMRCVLIGEYELAWPPSCDICLDNEVSVTFRPLAHNSSLKRRQDAAVIVPVKELINSHQIKIEQHYTGSSFWHFVTIVAVIQQSCEQIFNSIMTDPNHQISKEESLACLQALFQGSSCTGLQMQKIVISNRCQYYRSRIKYPCRSRHCQGHYQPFDLYSFICSSVQAKTSLKRWKCPICGVRAYDVIKDEYQREAMEQSGVEQFKVRSGALKINRK